MNRFPARLSLAALAAVLLGLPAAGCGSSEDAPPGSKKLSFELTDAGCVPNSTSAPAGPIVFEAENAGTSAVTEIEVMEGDNILGEKENLADGLSGSFSLTLAAGDYTIYCPGGSAEKGTLSVTGKSDAAAGAPGEKDAIARYRGYLEHNSDELVEETEPFVAAVIAGHVAKAKALYAAARIPYERIEKALWDEGSAKGMAPVAEQLLADVEGADARKLAQEIDALAEELSQVPAQIVG